MVGRILSHYRILSEISRGGMGVVYCAVDTKLNREVALKVLPPELVSDPERRRRFVQEAQAAAALEHPNIAVVHEIDEAEGETFVVMELIHGEMLRETFQRKRLSLERSLELATEVAEGLACAHDKGIVHRDLKPGNIMLTEQGHAKIIDFGLAKLVEPLGKEGSEATTALREETADGRILGTIAYMSPEQARGQKVDHRSDIFSFGAVLYEMLSGRLPFEGPTGADILNAILSKPTPRLPDLGTEASSDLQRLVDKCLNKDPNERYQTIKDAAVDLRAARRLVESPAVRGKPVTKRGGALAAIFALAVIAILVFGLWERFLGTGDPDPIQSLAVLPLENLSGDPEQEYFADGMTEALIAELGKIGALRVISRTSVMMYKEVRKPLSEIARELNVDAVVEGSVLRSGNRIRITMQLVQASPEKHLWAENYEQDMRDVIALQGEVARTVAREIQATVTPSEEARLASALPVNPEAHDAYLKGRYYLYMPGIESMQMSLAYFQEATRRDPESALAYAGLSGAYRRLAQSVRLPPSEAYQESKAAAARSLEIDDQCVEAHVSMAASKYIHDFDWSGAERDFRRAIELNPNHAVARREYATLLSVVGKTNQAVAEIKLAQALGPLDTTTHVRLGQIYYHGRLYDEAIEQLQKTLEMPRRSYWPYSLLGRAYLQKGMTAEAIKAFQTGYTTSEEDPGAMYCKAHAHVLEGKREDASKIIRELQERDYVWPFQISVIYCVLGETDSALHWLERAYHERDAWMAWISVEATFDPLRSHPRFRDLIRRMNYPE